jgi:acyl-CoA synthetase (AMP-forming)/AMP-acid ligase II
LWGVIRRCRKTQQRSVSRWRGALLPFALDRAGGVLDLGLGLRWDAAVLRREVERRAGEFARRGIGRGAVIAIAHGGTAYFYADLLAVWRVGATAACLDPALTAREYEAVITFLRPAAILIDRDATTSVSDVPQVALAAARDAEGAPALAAPDPDDAALILFTSGTTGSPKGVVLSFRALQARIELNIAEIGIAALRRALVTLPTHFGHGLIGNALTPLFAGGEIILHPLGLPLAQRLTHLIDEHAISFLSSVPALWRLVLKLASPPSGSMLARIHVGSAPLSAALWSDIVAWSRAEVVNCYGMTEAANWIAGASSRSAMLDGLVGRPWGGAAAVAGDDGMRRSSGEGEIVVQSPALMSGYLHRPDLTATVLRDGWLHTGDRGVIDEHGIIRLTGRIKDEINRAGLKIQPAEIDMLIESHPAVAEACTFALADAVSGERVAAAVRLAPGAVADEETLRTWCRERMRGEAIPERWFFVEEMPGSPRGKKNRDAVRRQLAGAGRA